MTEIGAWLRGLGLGQYEAAFRENDIGPAVLPKLTAEDLKVWLGNASGAPKSRLTGGGLPAQVWRAVVAEASRGAEAPGVRSSVRGPGR